ncbi:MAG: methionine adenosyltransferase [Burkholderiales bacterium]
MLEPRSADAILVEAAARPPLAERRLEICEHKGAGHPDTLTDGACEAAAPALADAYRQAVGDGGRAWLPGPYSSPRRREYPCRMRSGSRQTQSGSRLWECAPHG